jgi:glycerol dehydrogenase-like iron-containing ADH family enzyme
VLSVDNLGTLPWLPEEAIVEVPVKVEHGELTQRRGAVLPMDIQGLITQNCAYEMLAAEAIAEKDRDKALRALRSNLLITNFNQARGILNLVWPDNEKERFQIQGLGVAQPSGLGFKVPALYYGEDLVELYDPPEEEFALITMEELWERVSGRFQRQPATVIFVRELDWYQLEAMERAFPEIGAIVGLGGGVAQDAAKYIGWRRHIPVDEIVSITSVDASVTKSIAARAGGHVTYIGYIVPRNVYVDYQLIQSAPARLNRSGVGDILCAHTALFDWRFAHKQIGETYDPQAVTAMHRWLRTIQQESEDIRKVTPRGAHTIMEAFEKISIICRKFGSSRPQEASDHTFAYNAEYQTGKSFLHGELVALGAWVMAHLQENNPEFLEDTYERTGILWQPEELGLTRPEFTRILTTLNWYQDNFGRRFSILNRCKIEPAFIDRVAAHLRFPDEVV